MADRPNVSGRGFLDFYGQYGIVPVSQSNVPATTLRRRRLALYRCLGIPELAFRGAKILEIGPGTGEHAAVIDSLGPRSLTLLEANPESIKSIRRLIRDGRIDASRCQVLEADFLDESLPSDSFDVVLAEGCIPSQQDPIAALRSASRFVTPSDGIFVITTVDSVSALADLCRRLLKPLFSRGTASELSSQADNAGSFFESHLQQLPGVVRSAKDWVLDSILHPWTPNWQLPLGVALDALSDFQFLGSSPSFYVDWRWYKVFGSPNETWTNHAQSQWRQSRMFTVDQRISNTDALRLSSSAVAEFSDLADSFADLVHSHWTSDDLTDVSDVIFVLDALAEILRHDPLFEATHSALVEYRDALPSLARGDLSHPLDRFASWWGRGQQYVSLTRQA